MEQIIQPSTLGLAKTFGFGDRLGMAGRGHLEALKGYSFKPILAQQSIRELTRIGRTPDAVIDAARTAIIKANYQGSWGADADHLKTPQDVAYTAAAGFTFFTIDPSEHVNNRSDTMEASELEQEVEKQNNEGLYGGARVQELYLCKSFPVSNGRELQYDAATLLRAAVKYGRAVAHCETMAKAIAKETSGRQSEIEISVDETDQPTSPLEHLFFTLELKRRGVPFVSLAPRFIGDFEKGIDYKGDLAAFETDLRKHFEIAQAFGPYKISIHSGSDKFSIYPVISRVCGDLLHVKTSGTSYLEALRTVCRTEPALFAEIARYCLGRFEEDKMSYHISVTPGFVQGVRIREDARTMEDLFLNDDQGRQILHVTFGSVLSKGTHTDGRSFRDAILETLSREEDLHTELLAKHLGKHLRLLS
ncbi:MAG: tagaturonate epimerase family protein [Opitutales bacterium]|nr:tagaturonate epimerase family protein [Opitutales bacterium]